MKKSIIVAVDEAGGIGRSNDLMWHLREDLKRFKAITTGHSIVMGRNTYHSLPNGALPNRRNIVVSTTLTDPFEGITCLPTIEDAIAYAQSMGEDELFIIGGGKLYASTINLVDKMYLTRVHHTFHDADTFFPEWNSEDWAVVKTIHCPADDNNEFDTTFYELEKR